jgi:hypothetical protein
MAYKKLQKSSVTTAPASGIFQASRAFSEPKSVDVAQDVPQQDIQRSLSDSNCLGRISIYPPTFEAPVLQPKLTIGAANDRYEKEANQVAHQVVTKIHSPAFRTPQPQANESIQRQIGPRIAVMRKPTAQGQAATATPDLEASIRAARGCGHPIRPRVRELMEQAFEADFSQVRIHTDAQSDQLNRSIQARAFTTGQDIFFRKGEYNLNSMAGQELMAHELTHVVQQTGQIQRSLPPDSPGNLVNLSPSSVPQSIIQCDRDEPNLDETDQLRAEQEIINRPLYSLYATAGLIDVAVSLNAELMSGRLGPQMTRERARTLLSIYRTLQERLRSPVARTDEDGLPQTPGSPYRLEGEQQLDDIDWEASSPLAGMLEDIAPFSNVDLWTSLASDRSTTARRPARRRPVPPPTQEAEETIVPPSRARRRARRRPLPPPTQENEVSPEDPASEIGETDTDVIVLPEIHIRLSTETMTAPRRIGPFTEDPFDDERVQEIIDDAIERASEDGGTLEEQLERAWGIVQSWREQSPADVASQNPNYAAADHYFHMRHNMAYTPLLPEFQAIINAGLIYGYDALKSLLGAENIFQTGGGVPSQPDARIREWALRGLADGLFVDGYYPQSQP